MSRMVVNVATHPYLQGQFHLCQEMQRFGERPMIWNNCLPEGCPPHSEVPYAFKAYALREAKEIHYTTLLWSDASVIPIRPLAPLWDLIERQGYWFARNGWMNSEWTADSAYPELFPNIPIEEARKVNAKIPHVVATALGLDLRHTVGNVFFHEYLRLASQTKAFCGPWTNAPEVNEAQRRGPCGPATTLGHRHDQTAASVIAWRLKMHLTDTPNMFCYAKSDKEGKPIVRPEEYDERTILLAVGA
jgi:hypothetical protein